MARCAMLESEWKDGTFFFLGGDTTYLENRFRMRPAGVVSKKLIGLLKIANAILSCNFLDACAEAGSYVSLA
jgi:hypothetical protein